MKAINIKWDTDGDIELLKKLPVEMEIPDDITDEEEISDYLSDKTGFCHDGFELFGKKINFTGGNNMNEHEKARECMEFLRKYCKEDGSNCTKNCPFAYEDYTIHCNLGGEPMYPGEWETEQKLWKINKK